MSNTKLTQGVVKADDNKSKRLWSRRLGLSYSVAHNGGNDSKTTKSSKNEKAGHLITTQLYGESSQTHKGRNSSYFYLIQQHNSTYNAIQLSLHLTIYIIFTHFSSSDCTRTFLILLTDGAAISREPNSFPLCC